MSTRNSVVFRGFNAGALPWLLPATGFAVLYAPAYFQLLTQTWRSDDTAYGYFIFAIALWLFWLHRADLKTGDPQHSMAITEVPAPVLGSIVLGGGLLLQIFGRSQEVFALEVASQIPVATGALLCLCGARTVRRLWFPLGYLIFLVPVPPLLLELATAPLKQLVSSTVASLLYHAGYPIARSGVVLQVGGYRLLVADACSGLNSIFSLFALGVVYLHLTRRRLWLQWLMLASIVPIACAANVVRVILLVLITYHFGNDAGQGFLHGAASIALLISALVLFLLLDETLLRITRRRTPPASAGGGSC
ncbi:MAG: exosortase B [Spongiibacteraceae bacterium]